MAFENQTPPPPVVETRSKTVVRESGFDGSAFIGIIIGILILAAILFFFRNAIASKLAEWRGSGTVVSTLPTPPKVSPVPTITPTPTATVTATPRATAPVVTRIDGEEFPSAGPADTAVVALLGAGGLAAGLSSARARFYKRRLKRQLENIDIA